MLEIIIRDPAGISAAESNAVILLLQTLQDAVEIRQAGPAEVKVVRPLAIAAPSIADAEVLPTAPEAREVFSQAPTNVVPLPPSPQTATATVPPPPAGSVELDARGLPWDGRIHASTRVKIQDGSWRQKRGTDPAYVAQVEGELRGAQAAPAAPPPPPAVNAAPTPEQAANYAAAIEAATPLSFPQLLQRITAAVSSGKFTQANVIEACNAAGVPSLPVLATRPDLVPSVATMLGV